MQPIVASPSEYGYRNRIRIHVEGGSTGFYAHGSHALVEITECPIAAPEVNEALQRLRTSPVRDGDYTLAGRERGGFFEQTNDAVAAELLELVRTSLRPGQGLLVDAYCGAGFFAHHLAADFERVVGIEENIHAVERARRRALPHERYHSGDVGLLLGEILADGDPKRTTVILDPPAVGLALRVSDHLARRAAVGNPLCFLQSPHPGPGLGRALPFKQLSGWKRGDARRYVPADCGNRSGRPVVGDLISAPAGLPQHSARLTPTVTSGTR